MQDVKGTAMPAPAADATTAAALLFLGLFADRFRLMESCVCVGKKKKKTMMDTESRKYVAITLL